MENTRAAERMVRNRRFGGVAALCALLAVLTSGASFSPEADTHGRDSLELAPPSASNADAQLGRRAAHVDPYADGVIDTFEDDDSGRGEPDASCLERLEVSVGARPSVQPPTSAVLPRSYLARGPPSA